ncbi:hypothetical protein ACFWF7_40420 [Nocardia sp. NPDC060256]|uniref:hypothetical protein n=1 Tax=unclassified Nocardia TaxID=2637762 RepID=UPI003650BBFC
MEITPSISVRMVGTEIDLASAARQSYPSVPGTEPRPTWTASADLGNEFDRTYVSSSRPSIAAEGRLGDHRLRPRELGEPFDAALLGCFALSRSVP